MNHTFELKTKAGKIVLETLFRIDNTNLVYNQELYISNYDKYLEFNLSCMDIEINPVMLRKLADELEIAEKYFKNKTPRPLPNPPPNIHLK